MLAELSFQLLVRNNDLADGTNRTPAAHHGGKRPHQSPHGPRTNKRIHLKPGASSPVRCCCCSAALLCSDALLQAPRAVVFSAGCPRTAGEGAARPIRAGRPPHMASQAPGPCPPPWPWRPPSIQRRAPSQRRRRPAPPPSQETPARAGQTTAQRQKRNERDERNKKKGVRTVAR